MTYIISNKLVIINYLGISQQSILYLYAISGQLIIFASQQLSRFKNYFLYYYSIVTSVMGKAEGEGNKWHGHLTFLSVQPEYRR